MPLNNIVTSFALTVTLFAPPATDPGNACEIRVQVPDKLSRSRIEGKISKNIQCEYNMQILDWPTQYADASPPALRWYKVVEDADGWTLIYRDIDDHALTETRVQLTGNAIEDDISGEIAMLAIAACHAHQSFVSSVAELELESQREWTTPPNRAPVTPPAPTAYEGVGLVATSLSFGLAGLVLGVGGFAYAYDARIRADRQTFDCERTGVSSDECRGRASPLMWRKRSMVATGVGSTGAAMLGVGLILAIPAGMFLSRRRQAWRSNPVISVWATRTGGGLGLAGRF